MAAPSRPSSPPDAELVARALRRGPDGHAAFAALVERHRPAALGACRRAAFGQEALAADAVQEAVLHALLALDRLREPSRFGAWLTGIALNVCRRGALRAGRTDGGLDADLVPGGAPDPAEEAQRLAASARVRAAIAALPAGQREAVTLFYLAGLTQAEVAEHLGTAEGAVKTRLHKARATLRRHLDDLREEPMSEGDATATATAPVPVRVADVVASGREGWSATHIVVLEEVDGPRRLPIWIGAGEATALAVALEQVELPRPGTYALTASLLQAAGRRVAGVRLSALTGDVFFAEIALDDGAVVDARPSDALNLALASGAPITVDPAVLARGSAPAPPFRDEAAAAPSIRGQVRAAAEAMHLPPGAAEG